MKLVSAIEAIGGPTYSFASIDPVDDKDGGAPGGNIRQAYLYDSRAIQLHNPNQGSSVDANAVLPGPTLKFNPGRVEPLNAVWTRSRKPLVAAWQTLDGKNNFFTINVHFTSKLGSSPIGGDYRPPINKGIETREAQMMLTADFVTRILKQDANAKIIVSGDFNEFAFLEPMEKFKSVSGLYDLDDIVRSPEKERYSTIFERNCQQLDYTYVSKALTKGAAYEHIHVNTWANLDEQITDHDPSVAMLDVCQ
jgi:predicted extracellular nuclease